MAPKFDNYSSRLDPKKDQAIADQQQVNLEPNREYVLRSLTLGMIDFDK